MDGKTKWSMVPQPDNPKFKQKKEPDKIDKEKIRQDLEFDYLESFDGKTLYLMFKSRELSQEFINKFITPHFEES